MSLSKRFLIIVKTLQGNFLHFEVPSYEIEDGALVKFVDQKTGEVKRFSAGSCEIKELKDEKR